MDHNFWTAPDLDRAIPTLEGFLAYLLPDPRVQRTYRRWAGQVRRIFDDFKRKDPTNTDANLFGASLYQSDCAPRTQRLVRRLRLPYPYPWLPPLLVRIFQIQLTEEFTGKQFAVVFQPATPEPRQPHESVAAYFQRLSNLNAKRPGDKKTTGEDCIRDVAWLYRAKIQQPPERSTELGKEYREHHPTPDMISPENNGRQMVDAGIKRAAAILSSITLHDSLELPPDALDDVKARRAARRTARR